MRREVTIREHEYGYKVTSNRGNSISWYNLDNALKDAKSHLKGEEKMNLIKQIEKIQDQELKEKWKDISNIALFDTALEIAKQIQEGDETGIVEKRLIVKYIELFAQPFNFRLITKRETNGTWEG